MAKTLALSVVVKALLKEHATTAAAADALAGRVAKDAALRRALCLAYLTRLTAGKTAHSRRRPGAHRRPAEKPMPSKEQKLGALTAEASYVAVIFDRKLRGGHKLGEIRVHELRAIAESSAQTATSFLQRGFEDAVDTFACIGLSRYCTASDPFAKVSEVIKPGIAAKIFDQAKISAAEALRDGSGKLARDLITQAQQTEITAQ